MNKNVHPGIHPAAVSVIERSFTNEEKYIARFWSNEWYVTKAGQISLGASYYRFILIKATPTYEEALGLSREIVVLFSPYAVFEPRTLDAYDSIYKLFQDLRIERICYVLISPDPDIEQALRECLSNQESQIIVPFIYSSFKAAQGNPNFLRNQFRKFFHSRDLFDYSDPLKKDFYFFGRNNLVIDIIEKHKSNSNAGLFGLRKTGKTSIIYDIIRKLPQEDAIGVLIDCQNTSFNFRRWNQALYYIIFRICQENNITFDGLEECKFTEIDAAILFEKYLMNINERLSKSILLLFDEIENITFDKSSSHHWCDGLDFVYFWQSIRSTFQNTRDIFTFCIFGTNPRCIEIPTIKGKDNPIFNVFQPKYIPGFEQSQTREMVRKLGRLMGIKFEEGVYTRLTEDYGGHPFLIRRVSSSLAQKYVTRPVTIDRTKYSEIRDKFNHESDYFNMLLEVLIQFYPDEYEMLNILATGDSATFEYYASNDYNLVKHLIGYGIIKEVDDKYDFQIDAIKEYLFRKQQKQLPVHSRDEKWAYLCVQRGGLEVDLRKMVKTVLRFRYINEADAKEFVVRKVYGGDARKYSTHSYSDLFDSRKSNIYLKSLKDLINCNWDHFKSFFGDQEMFIASMNILNREGRFDAHATIPEDSEIILINGAIENLRKGIDSFQVAID